MKWNSLTRSFDSLVMALASRVKTAAKAAVLIALAVAATFASFEVHAQAKTEQELRAQEEALLRQLAGGSIAESSAVKTSIVSPSANPSAAKSSEMTSTANTAATITDDAEDILDVRDSSVESPVTDNSVAHNSATESVKLEQLIDEQARAALAMIDQAKNGSSSSASNSGTNSGTAKIITAPMRSKELDSETVVAPKAYVNAVQRDESPVHQVRKLSSELGVRESELSELRMELQNAQKRNAAAEARTTSLSKQLEGVRAKLMVAETEVERLSRVLETRNNSTIAQFNPNQFNSAQSVNAQRTANRNGASYNTAQQTRAVSSLGTPATVVRERVIVREGKQVDDLPIVMVTADKANLRTGPGQDNSSIIAVSRGTRLVVETKQGSWYRVLSPNGVRAWVSADTVELQR